MTCILTLLRNLWASLISSRQAGKRQLKPAENQLEKQVTECDQAKKLQQTSNLLASLLLQLVTAYRQTETQLKNATGENESLKQTVQDLQQKSATLERDRDEVRETLYRQTETQLKNARSENESLKQTVQDLQKKSATLKRDRDEARETLTKLHLKNTLLEQKVEQLESHKKALIQELGGSVSFQDIEFITWDFLIQKVKQVTNQLNEAIVRNQSLSNTNRDLEHERNGLRRELNQVKDNNTKLIQDNSQLRSNNTSLKSEHKQLLDQVQLLERAKSKLEQGKPQFHQAESEIAQLEWKVENLKQNQNNLERELKQEKAKVTSVEQKTKDLEKAKNQLETELKQERSKIVPLEQKVKGLEQAKNQLETELKQERAKLAPFEQRNQTLEQAINRLETAVKQEKNRVTVLERESNNLSTDRNENENTTYDNMFSTENSQLNQTIKQLTERIKQLENQPDTVSSENQQRRSDTVSSENQQGPYNRYYYQPSSVLDDVNLLEQYNYLVDFVQKSLSCSGIEELANWENTEEFYIELISRLCFIDTILIAELEGCGDNSYGSYNSPYYPGKVLYWINGVVRWELGSFLNSKF